MANTVYTYPHIEDYIEFIAGYKDVAGRNKYSIFQLPESPINLARYDVKVLESFGEQCHNGTAFTDRQAKLAVDLVVKYERQLFKLKVDITPVKVKPTFRLPLREIDRTTRAWVDNNQIKVQFPYNIDMIESIRNESKEGKGSIKFNRTTKIWEADLTEYNVNWAHTFSRTHSFEIDSSLQSLMDLILAAEKTDYKIELQAEADQLSITNAEQTLINYINKHLGGFGTDNVLALIDNSSQLGYTANKIIESVIIDAYGPRFWSLCTNRELKVDLRLGMQYQIDEIVRYATVTNRFPIYLYEPDMSDKLAMLFIRHFEKAQVANLTNKDPITENTRLAYTSKIPRDPVNHIPLLISGAGMIFGGDRQVWLQNAEKVVYFTNDVYNKGIKKGKDICRLS